MSHMTGTCRCCHSSFLLDHDPKSCDWCDIEASKWELIANVAALHGKLECLVNAWHHGQCFINSYRVALHAAACGQMACLSFLFDQCGAAHAMHIHEHEHVEKDVLMGLSNVAALGGNVECLILVHREGSPMHPSLSTWALHICANCDCTCKGGHAACSRYASTSCTLPYVLG